MKTELISSVKPVTTSKGGKEMLILTTIEGNVVWVPKSQFDASADTVTFNSMKKDDTYTKADGSQGQLIADRNEFVGCNKQVVKKYSTMEIMDHLISKGITPTFAMA